MTLQLPNNVINASISVLKLNSNLITSLTALLQNKSTHRCLTHDAVCAVGGGSTRGGAVVIGSASAASPSVEARHGRKAGADICRRVGWVALQRDGRNEIKF